MLVNIRKNNVLPQVINDNLLRLFSMNLYLVHTLVEERVPGTGLFFGFYFELIFGTNLLFIYRFTDKDIILELPFFCI